MEDLTGKKIVMMAGGTGGHVYPALAVAERLKALGAEIFWIGNAKGFEYSKVTAQNYDFIDIQVEGIRGKNKLKAPFMLLKALFLSFQGLRKIKPDLMVAFGGFGSLAGVWAKVLNIPLVIHEQNAIFGWTNQKLAHWATKILLGQAIETVHQDKTVLTGNPVRQAIARIDNPAKRFLSRSGKVRLLVLGGSQGAQALNDLIPKALAFIPEEERPEIIHQVGAKNVEAGKSAYANAGVNGQVVPFIEDMASAYADADFIIARSGALTVAEIATAGLSALFVPFPHAVDNHQFFNAQGLVKIGSATVMNQSELTAEALADWIKNQNNRGELLKKATLARTLSHAEALDKICAELMAVLKK